jgi:predicted regulator of Ras-like GTPase activity (Roadblock/LC7/MglB family)
MSFESILRTVVEGSGALGAALMGSDGIAVAQVQSRRAPGSPPEDIGTAGVEFVRILEEIRKASDALGAGAVQETAVGFARFTLIFRAVDDDLFVVLALPPDGNLGKARYLIRRNLLPIRQEL